MLIQTNNPQQKLLHQIAQNDYEGLYQSEIEERQGFAYPPFTRLIRLTIKHTEEALANKTAQALSNKLAEKLSKQRVLGPEKPLVERIRNQFIYEILIKLEKSINLKGAKQYIHEQVESIVTDKQFKGASIIIDVDCM